MFESDNLSLQMRQKINSRVLFIPQGSRKVSLLDRRKKNKLPIFGVITS